MTRYRPYASCFNLPMSHPVYSFMYLTEFCIARKPPQVGFIYPISVTNLDEGKNLYYEANVKERYSEYLHNLINRKKNWVMNPA